MRILVLGISNDQLLSWARSIGCDTILSARLMARMGHESYRMLVPRPNDDRIAGLEFDKIIPLDGITSVDVCYLSRIRTKEVKS